MLALMRNLSVSIRHPLALAAVLQLLVGVTAGCNDEDDAASGSSNAGAGSGTTPTPTPTPGDPDLITKTGTVRHLDFEGGFWGIVADDSTRYDPGTLDSRFQVDGLRVRYDARVNAGQMSIRQWGTLVTIERIDRL
jgi:hypothetical protein